MTANIEKKSSAKSGWLIPTGLILLSVLPLIGGAHRLAVSFGFAQLTKDDLRFASATLLISVHALSSLVYFMLGAFQFSPSLRARRLNWHRVAGRVLILCGLVSAISGIWMALVLPPLFGDGKAITYVRLAVGSATILFIVKGFIAIRRRQFDRHRAFMMRGYALAIGAGTQPFTFIPTLLIPAQYEELRYTIGLTAGWLLNMVVAE